MLNEAGATLQHVYFPRTALVSLVGLTADGHATEVGMVGAEGFCGVPVVLGSRIQRFEATVQVSGSLEKVAVHVLEEKSGKTPLSDVLRRYALTQFDEIAQSSICNRFHTLSQRLCRWLLTASDRVATHQLDLTQEYMAQMIGAQRSAVAEVLGGLEQQGLVTRTRGCVEIIHRPGMQSAACECYGLMKEAIEAFLGALNFHTHAE